MPRRMLSLAKPAPTPSRSLVASAAVLSGQKTERIYNPNRGEWQSECYRHYRICGEARFAATFFGHALSKTTLYVTDKPDDPRAEKVTSGPAYELLQALFNGSEGQAAMLSSIGVHFTIAGECYLIGRTLDDDLGKPYEAWEIRSVLEVERRAGNKWYIKPAGGQTDIPLADDDVVIRLWTPDPAHAIEADSPFRSLLPILEEIEWLTRYVFAQCSSRLAGAGLLMMPEEIDVPPPPDVAGENRATLLDASKSDQLMATLASAMLKPISDPGNPAAKIPVVLTAPGDQIDKARWMNFWTELDTEAKSLRQEAIQRFALGMDLPPERVLGMSSNGGTGGGSSNGVSHWGAWQIDEDTIKMHVEPMLDVVVQGLTVGYLRPTTQTFTDTVRYDTSSLRLRPDRSAESIEMYDRGWLKGAVMLRENGFDPEADAMSPDERQQWMLWKIAGGSATPQMVADALSQVGIEVEVGTVPGLLPNDARPAPSLDAHPRRPATPEAAALLAASEGLVFRALERAGNRLRSRGTRPPGISSYETHTVFKSNQQEAKSLLTDAWPCAPQVLEGLSEHDKVVPILDAYVSSLLVSGRPHSREALAVWLEKL